MNTVRVTKTRDGSMTNTMEYGTLLGYIVHTVSKSDGKIISWRAVSISNPEHNISRRSQMGLFSCMSSEYGARHGMGRWKAFDKLTKQWCVSHVNGRLIE